MPYENIDAAIEALEAIYYSDAVRGAETETDQPPAAHRQLGMDAHTYTRTLIRNGYPVLVEADQQFVQSNTDLDFPTLREQLNQHMRTLSLEQFSQAQRDAMAHQFRLIETFLRRNPSGVEADETRISVPQLLSRVWHLANLRTARNTADPISPLTRVLMNISSNILDEGHCIPGVVARLYIIYTLFLVNELRHRRYLAQQEQLRLLEEVRPPMPRVTEALLGNIGAVNENDELQRAIRESENLAFIQEEIERQEFTSRQQVGAGLTYAYAASQTASQQRDDTGGSFLLKEDPKLQELMLESIRLAQQQSSQPQPKSRVVERSAEDDEELNLALALSLSEIVEQEQVQQEPLTPAVAVTTVQETTVSNNAGVDFAALNEERQRRAREKKAARNQMS